MFQRSGSRRLAVRFPFPKKPIPEREENPLVFAHLLDGEALGNGAGCRYSRGEQEMPFARRRKKVACQPKIIGIVNNEQAVPIIDKLLFDCFDDEMLVWFIFNREINKSGNADKAFDQGFKAGRIDPQNEVVLISVAISILDGNLRFADASKTGDRW